jgi:hypothetical protein
MPAPLAGQQQTVGELQAAYHRQLNLRDGYRFTITHKASGKAVNSKAIASYRPVDFTHRRTIADITKRFEIAFEDQSFSCRIETHNHAPAPNTLVSNLERA